MNYIYLLSPIITIYIISLFYPVTNNAGRNVSFRPPSYIFAIVWPILLLLIGYSWNLRPNISYLYIVLILLLAAWIILFSISKKLAFYEIVLTVLFTIFILFYKYKTLSSLLLIPLILWLSFASVLNYYTIN
jgi:benzodiazapine receptor